VNAREFDPWELLCRNNCHYSSRTSLHSSTSTRPIPNPTSKLQVQDQQQHLPERDCHYSSEDVTGGTESTMRTAYRILQTEAQLVVIRCFQMPDFAGASMPQRSAIASRFTQASCSPTHVLFLSRCAVWPVSCPLVTPTTQVPFLFYWSLYSSLVLYLCISSPFVFHSR
jgi:hypothetical protein